MIDDPTFFAWLREDSDRVVIIELDFQVQQEDAPSIGTVRMVTQNYDDGNLHYFDCVKSVPNFSRDVDKKSLGGAASVSFGSVVVDNPDGRMDFLLDLACDGSGIRLYLGDVSWDRADFRLMFSANVHVITAPDPSTISIAIQDVGLLLNKSVGGDVLVGGTGPNADRPRPYFFGYVHNLQAILEDVGFLTYVYGTQGSLVAPTNAVRDEGIAVVYADLGDGTFNLAASPAGLVTADIFRGAPDPDAGARCGQLIDEIATTLGGLSTAAGTYLGAHPSFQLNGPDDYPVGIFVADTTNLLDLLTQVMTTALAFWATTRDGRFTFGRFRPDNISGLGVPRKATLTIDDVATVDGIVLDRQEPSYFAAPVLVNKNWQTQSSFAGALTADEQALYTRPGYTVDPTLTPVDDDYTTQPQLYHTTMVKAPLQETLISAATDADALPFATRWIQTRIAQVTPWVDFFDVTTDLRFFYLELGDVVGLDLGGRLGLDSQSVLQVLGIDILLDDNTVKLTLVRRRPANVVDVEHDTA